MFLEKHQHFYLRVLVVIQVTHETQLVKYETEFPLSKGDKMTQRRYKGMHAKPNPT